MYTPNVTKGIMKTKTTEVKIAIIWIKKYYIPRRYKYRLKNCKL